MDEFVDNFVLDEEQQRGNILDLFRTPAMRRNSILMCYCWLSFSMGYFGLFYNIPPLNWSPFLVFAVPAVFSVVKFSLCTVRYSLLSMRGSFNR